MEKLSINVNNFYCIARLRMVFLNAVKEGVIVCSHYIASLAFCF